jgi:hypothetical protein
MRPWQFLYTAPSEGWKFATSVFSFSWTMATLLPIILIRGEQPLGKTKGTQLFVDCTRRKQLGGYELRPLYPPFFPLPSL